MTILRSGPVLRTARLRLRPFVPGDAPAITAALTDPSTDDWYTPMLPNYRLRDAEDFVVRSQGKPYWAVEKKGMLIGTISVNPDLGYWLAAPFHGQGLMSEAAKAVVQWYFDQTTDVLCSRTHAENRASRQLLLRLGFHDTALLRNVTRRDGSVVDIQRMQLTKARWETRAGAPDQVRGA